MRKITLFFILFVIQNSSELNAQTNRWQQKIKYQIDVKMDVSTNLLTGKEKIEYINNSPDTLSKLFFHAYWNAFQPNSSMDVRSRELGKTIIRQDRNGKNVLDWDSRVTNRISFLKEKEIGFQNVKSIIINGKQQKLLLHETIVEVVLDKPIYPNSKVLMDVDFVAQVPVQIRRSGRDNA